MEHFNVATDPIVVHLLAGDQLPHLIQLGKSTVSPYVIMWLTDHAGNVLGDKVRWQVKQDTFNPVWNSAQELCCQLEPSALQGASVHIEVWDCDILPPHNLIGSAIAPLSQLPYREHCSVQIQPSPLASMESPADDSLSTTLKRAYNAVANKWQPAMSDSPSTSLGGVRLRMVNSFPRKKRLYFVRHAESLWNKGEKEKDLITMFSQIDHPLSSKGRQQAETLAAAIAAARKGIISAEHGVASGAEVASLCEMCTAKTVLCSPLTRTVQTCLFALGPTLREGGQVVRLTPNLREKRNTLVSMDNVGMAVGKDEVRARLMEMTTELLFDGDADAAIRAVGGVPFDGAEVGNTWWSAGPDTPEEVDERLATLLRQVRYSEEEVVVLVGHSHWFREFLRAYLSDVVDKLDPDLAAQLRTLKLSNAGAVRVDLDFDHERPIVGVQLLAGSTLVK